MERRTFLTGTAAWVGMSWLAPSVLNASGNTPKFAANPFTLGVASGEPWEDSVVLWTRLAPDALNGGGMSAASVEVKWELASDEQMKTVVASGTAMLRRSWGTLCTLKFSGCNRRAGIGTALWSATKSARLDARARLLRRACWRSGSTLPLLRASITRRVGTRLISICAKSISTWSSFWAITFTSTA